jgi:hypothetical protein
LRLLLCFLWRAGRTLAASAAPATTPSFARRLLAFRARLLLLLLRFLWSRGLRPAVPIRLRRSLTLAIPIPFSLLLRTLWPFATAPRRTLFFARAHAGALLEFAHFLVHEPPRLLFQLVAGLVMAAVRAALPSLGIGAFARRTENAFWQRH